MISGVEEELHNMREAEVLEKESDTITGSGRLDKEEHHVRNYTIQ
jgi:hypothetical protein